MKLGILNTTIATTDGSYLVETIGTEEAIGLVADRELDSAVGHEATAQMMTTVLGVHIPMNRQQLEQQVGQECLVFKLNGRAPEGVILSREEVEKIGFVFKKMTRLK
jgi:hypothetical protein